MNIFLNTNFNNVNFLDESLLDTIKKFYTGKSETELEDLKDELNKAKSKTALTKVNRKINKALKTAEDFKRTPVLQRFFGDKKSAATSTAVLAMPGGIPAVLSAAGLSVWFRSGKALKSLNAHIQKLLKLKQSIHSTEIK